MRASEFINELVSKDVAFRNYFRKYKKIVINKHGQKTDLYLIAELIKDRHGDRMVYITASLGLNSSATSWQNVNPEDYADPKVVGGVEFWIHTNHLESGDTWVLDDYQGLGIAKNMYMFAHELGNDIEPSEVQTGPGQALWHSINRDNLLPPHNKDAEKTSGQVNESAAEYNVSIVSPSELTSQQPWRDAKSEHRIL